MKSLPVRWPALQFRGNILNRRGRALAEKEGPDKLAGYRAQDRSGDYADFDDQQRAANAVNDLLIP